MYVVSCMRACTADMLRAMPRVMRSTQTPMTHHQSTPLHQSHPAPAFPHEDRKILALQHEDRTAEPISGPGTDQANASEGQEAHGVGDMGKGKTGYNAGNVKNEKEAEKSDAGSGKSESDMDERSEGEVEKSEEEMMYKPLKEPEVSNTVPYGVPYRMAYRTVPYRTIP